MNSSLNSELLSVIKLIANNYSFNWLVSGHYDEVKFLFVASNGQKEQALVEVKIYTDGPQIGPSGRALAMLSGSPVYF